MAMAKADDRGPARRGGHGRARARRGSNGERNVRLWGRKKMAPSFLPSVRRSICASMLRQMCWIRCATPVFLILAVVALDLMVRSSVCGCSFFSSVRPSICANLLRLHPGMYRLANERQRVLFPGWIYVVSYLP
ncbi:hypothetical protein ACQJBY_033975 [Aegilops geniculata]